MTAPDARRLAEIVEEGRRLGDAAASASGAQSTLSAVIVSDRFRVEQWPRLLAVAEAAVEVLADHDERVAIYGKREEQPNRRRVMEALRAAVRGEEKTS